MVYQRDRNEYEQSAGSARRDSRSRRDRHRDGTGWRGRRPTGHQPDRRERDRDEDGRSTDRLHAGECRRDERYGGVGDVESRVRTGQRIRTGPVGDRSGSTPRTAGRTTPGAQPDTPATIRERRDPGTCLHRPDEPDSRADQRTAKQYQRHGDRRRAGRYRLGTRRTPQRAGPQRHGPGGTRRLHGFVDRETGATRGTGPARRRGKRERASDRWNRVDCRPAVADWKPNGRW